MTEPRSPRVTVSFVDSYCATYKQLFPEVRSYESFRDLHLGIISNIKRKTPARNRSGGGKRKSPRITSFFE
jgi:SRSO17 transposase